MSCASVPVLRCAAWCGTTRPMEHSTAAAAAAPAAAAAASADIVRLNVGGTRFYTTRQTLLASPASHNPNFFHGLLSGRVGAARDEKGAYFIDRNPTRFAPVLDYLRTGHWEGGTSKEALAEASFYGVEVNVMLCVTDAHLRAVAHDSTLEAIAVHHDRLAELIALISPILIERVRRTQQTAPSVTIYIARRFTSEELVDEVLTRNTRALAQLVLPTYLATLSKPSEDTGALFINEAYAVLASIKNPVALAFYVKEHFKLTLFFALPNSGSSRNIIGWNDPGGAQGATITFGGGQYFVSTDCCHLTWDGNA